MGHFVDSLILYCGRYSDECVLLVGQQHEPTYDDSGTDPENDAGYCYRSQIYWELSSPDFSVSGDNYVFSVIARVYVPGADDKDHWHSNTDIILEDGTYHKYYARSTATANQKATAITRVPTTANGNAPTVPARTREEAIESLKSSSTGSDGRTYVYNKGFSFRLMESDGAPHSYGAWTVLTPATCTSAGIQTRSCSVCGSTETQTISPTGHNYNQLYTAARCGVDQVNKCQWCTATKVMTGTALSHAFDGGTITKQPTVYDTGVRTYRCTRSGCTGTKTETVAKKNFQIYAGTSPITRIYLGSNLIMNAAVGKDTLVR